MKRILASVATELGKGKRREKLSRQALRQLKIHAQEAEKAVGVKEAEIAKLEAQMADPSLYSDAQKSADVQRAYQRRSRRFKRFTNSGRLPRPPCLRRKPDIFATGKRRANNHAFLSESAARAAAESPRWPRSWQRWSTKAS